MCTCVCARVCASLRVWFDVCVCARAHRCVCLRKCICVGVGVGVGAGAGVGVGVILRSSVSRISCELLKFSSFDFQLK